MSSERSVKDLSGLYTSFLERAMGIEPTSEAWEAPVLPLNYARSLLNILLRIDHPHSVPVLSCARCREVKSAYACPDESRRSRSLLNGYSVLLASTKAPPLAENTEKSKGALIPRAPAIVTANNRSNTPLNRAAVRVCHPNSSKTPRIVSAQVETMARVVIVPFGKSQLSCPV